MGLESVDQITKVTQAAVRFSEGTHSSLLDPGTGETEFAAFLELQKQTALWIDSIETDPEVVITDSTVIEQQP